MSQRSIALAVRDHLRAKLSGIDGGGVGVDQVDIVPPPGRPPASAGELFVAVWEGGFSNNQTESRYDVHRVNVTITRRVPVAPYDREAEEIIHQAVIGLEVMADEVASLIHDNPDVRARANNFLAQLAANRTIYGFTEPLRFLEGTRTEEKGGEWFHGDGRERMAGRAITLYFGRALRLQSNALQA